MLVFDVVCCSVVLLLFVMMIVLICFGSVVRVIVLVSCRFVCVMILFLCCDVSVSWYGMV